MVEPDSGTGLPPAHAVARKVLAAFALAFLVSRILVFLIMSGRMPDIHAHLGGSHLHHYNYGIFLLAVVGAALLFARPAGRWLSGVAILYGAGLGLTFDELGIWLYLDENYWRRASFDAVIAIGTILGVLATAPTLKRFRPQHWATAAALATAVVVFSLLLVDSSRYAGRLHPLLEHFRHGTPR